MKKAIFVVVGPSGAGKSSFVDRAIEEFSQQLVDIVTYTTRTPREGEVHGEAYHFVEMAEFEKLRDSDFFVEWAQVHGNFYGTPKDQIERAWSQGQAVIMDIDVQGAREVRKTYPQATTIFVLPPSIDALHQRLKVRDKGHTENFDLRIKNAEVEMAAASEFDHQVINDDFDRSFAEFKKIIEENC